MDKKRKDQSTQRFSQSKKKTSLDLPRDYPLLLAEIKARIDASRLHALFLVNQERTLLYWNIGLLIHKRQKDEGWGKAVIPRLAQDLKRDYSDQHGFSERNLGRMVRFAKEYSDPSFLPQAVAKSSASGKKKVTISRQAWLETDSPLVHRFHEEWADLKCLIGMANTEVSGAKRNANLKSQSVTSTYGGHWTSSYSMTEEGVATSPMLNIPSPHGPF